MTVIHIDPINGNNANSGLSDEAAVLTPQNALTKAAAFFPGASADIEIALKDNWPINFPSSVFLNATHNRPGKHRLRWRSYGGGDATVTARTPVTGWAALTTYHPRGAVALHSGNARDLLCDAGFEPRRATQGRFNSSYRIHQWEPATKSVLINNALVPSVAGIGGMVIAIQEGWNVSYLPVAAIVASGVTGYSRVTFAEPAATVEFAKGTIATGPTDFAPGPYHKAQQRFWWENRVEFLTNTGDFVKWGDYFHLVLPVGMTASAFNALGAYVPNGLQTLFSINGTTTDDWADKADGIDFEGLRARHVGYVPTNFAADGWVGYDTNIAHRDGGFINLTGVITIQKARSISIRRCRGTQLSVPFLRVWTGVHGLTMEGNAFHDMDAGPINMAGSAGAGTNNGVPWTSLDNQPVEAQNIGLRMVDNVFLRTGRVLMGFTCSLGMWRLARVQRNLIQDMFGGGLQIGRGARWYEMWDYDWIVSHNHLKNVGTILTDIAAIYTNGNQSGRMPIASPPLHQLNVPLSTRLFGNKIEGVWKSDYDPIGGLTAMFYNDLGAQGGVIFLNFLKDGSTAFKTNGARWNSTRGNRVENVTTLIAHFYSALQIFPRGSNDGVRIWPPLNNPPTATDLEKWNGTGAYAAAIPFRQEFPFPSIEDVITTGGSYNSLSLYQDNGPSVPWNIEVGPVQEVRDRYADLLAA